MFTFFFFLFPFFISELSQLWWPFLLQLLEGCTTCGGSSGIPLSTKVSEQWTSDSHCLWWSFQFLQQHVICHRYMSTASTAMCFMMSNPITLHVIVFPHSEMKKDVHTYEFSEVEKALFPQQIVSHTLNIKKECSNVWLLWCIIDFASSVNFFSFFKCVAFLLVSETFSALWTKPRTFSLWIAWCFLKR